MSTYFENTQLGEVAAKELQSEILQGANIVLLDVRMPNEHNLCRLPNSILIPVHELPYRYRELDPAANIVVYCHIGIRSTEAVRMLTNAGFERVRNLAGGIDSWAMEVDPSVERY